MGRHGRRCLRCPGPAWTWTPGPLRTSCCPSLLGLSSIVQISTRYLICCIPLALFLCYFLCQVVLGLFSFSTALCVRLSFLSVIQVPSKNTMKGPKMIRLNFDYWRLLELLWSRLFSIKLSIDAFAPFIIWPVVKVAEGGGGGGGLKVNMLLAWSNLIQALFNLMCINKTFMQ